MASRSPVRRPSLVVLDVNETLSDLSSMADRFEQVGAPPHLARTWFAGVLRDGFALAAAGGDETFARIASESLRVLLLGLPGGSDHEDVDDAVEQVMAGFSALPVHPDVPDGLRALRDLGVRVVTLSNGAASVAESLLERAEVRDLVEQVLSVEDAGRWKPAPESYAYAVRRCGVEAHEAMLVAVHPWDVDGAARAGLATGWIDRTGGAYPSYFHEPDVRATSLLDLADQLR